MTEKRKRNAAKTVQELQLYPYRSKAENTLRCIVWIASWIIGIAIQQTLNSQSLGGAYFIFALSLLLEFIPESRTSFIAKIAHSIFCVLLIIMLLGALVLSYAFVYTTDSPTGDAKIYSVCLFLAQVIPNVGLAVCIWMAISIVLALTEIHKFIYDSDAKPKHEDENSQDGGLEQFMKNVNGPTKDS